VFVWEVVSESVLKDPECALLKPASHV